MGQPNKGYSVTTIQYSITPKYAQVFEYQDNDNTLAVFLSHHDDVKSCSRKMCG
ncbi:hypothetical protein AHF37_11242 [Paragonimus kellicotti]|nr:hypothetical protein AHF37_11242 [Paragonimus kellicotti]